MIAFDIPNTHRKGRRALRYRLKTSGFREMQESMFICPYDCEQELRDFIKIFKLERYVRFGLLDFIDGQDYFIKSFNNYLQLGEWGNDDFFKKENNRYE